MKKYNFLFLLIFSIQLNAASTPSRYSFTQSMGECVGTKIMDSSDGFKIGTSHYGTTDANISPSAFENCMRANSASFSLAPNGSISNLESCSGTTFTNGNCTYSLKSAISGNSIVANSISTKYFGNAIATCNGTVWSINSSFCTKKSATSCENQIVNWSEGSNTCSALSGNMKENQIITRRNITPEFEGSASLECNGGNISLISSSCDLGCDIRLGQEVNWSAGGYSCSGVVEKIGDNYFAEAKMGKEQVSKDATTANDEMKFVYGKARLTCSKGRWKFLTRPCDRITLPDPLVSCGNVDVERDLPGGGKEKQYDYYKCNWL